MLDFWQYEFMRNAVYAGLLVSVACGIVGVYVVVNRIVFISGGIAHSSFGGIGLGFLAGFSPVLGALAFACLGSGEMSSTAGGNPVSSAAVCAILDVMDAEDLVGSARKMGELMKRRLLEIQDKSRYLGDVRGRGLVMGMELVKDKDTKEPAPELTRQLIDRCAASGLLIGAVGVFGNVIRVAPPLTINKDEAHESLDIMERSLLSLET